MEVVRTTGDGNDDAAPTACRWPTSDTLFLVDSTLNVAGAANHRKMVRFVGDVMTRHIIGAPPALLDGGDSTTLALVQYTPEVKYEFGFVADGGGSVARMERRLNNVHYTPCLKWEYCERTATTWNAVVEWMWNADDGGGAGNRPLVPKVIVLVGTARWRPPARGDAETLTRPHSPIHVFQVLVGRPEDGRCLFGNGSSAVSWKKTDDEKELPFAATASHLAAADFDALSELVRPLCESVKSFLNGPINDGDSIRSATAPIIDQFLTGPLCILCVVLISVLSLVVVMTLIYVSCRYKQTGDSLRRQIAFEREVTRRQEEYFRGKLQERAEHDKERERTMIELVGESNRLRDAFRDEQTRHEQTMKDVVPVTFVRKMPHKASAPSASAIPGGAVPSIDKPLELMSVPSCSRAALSKRKCATNLAGSTSAKPSSNHLNVTQLPPPDAGSRSASEPPNRVNPGGSGSAAAPPTHQSSTNEVGRYRNDNDRPAAVQKDVYNGNAYNAGRQQQYRPRRLRATEGELESVRQSSSGGAETHLLRSPQPQQPPPPQPLPQMHRVVREAVASQHHCNGYFGRSRSGFALQPMEVFRPEIKPEGGTIMAEDDGVWSRSFTHLDADHPALRLPPVDVLLLVDASSSIGLHNFEMIKSRLLSFVDDVDICAGRSRMAVILFAAEPQVYFDFDKFYTNKSVRAAIRQMPFIGGSTFLARALSFAAGFLYRRQSLKQTNQHMRFLPTPRHDRPQIMVVVTDGASDDNFDRQAMRMQDALRVKIAAVATKTYTRRRLMPIAHYDGAIFTIDQMETLSIWLWNTQKMWNENFGDFVERERSVLTNAERSFSSK